MTIQPYSILLYESCKHFIPAQEMTLGWEKMGVSLPIYMVQKVCSSTVNKIVPHYKNAVGQNVQNVCAIFFSPFFVQMYITNSSRVKSKFTQPATPCTMRFHTRITSDEVKVLFLIIDSISRVSMEAVLILDPTHMPLLTQMQESSGDGIIAK